MYHIMLLSSRVKYMKKLKYAKLYTCDSNSLFASPLNAGNEGNAIQCK